ncbi:hypothetical protein Dda_0255 [Drechslerella dactyloides]|uniref:Uncharacterized protein n=1 Tax=Drechslerella dactyloides TaxID=74499 RepID=A0AAD6NP06_DREDA|nr:hypothetical protein Dda_0255 [Drechslerella dactyloides]
MAARAIGELARFEDCGRQITSTAVRGVRDSPKLLHGTIPRYSPSHATTSQRSPQTYQIHPLQLRFQFACMDPIVSTMPLPRSTAWRGFDAQPLDELAFSRKLPGAVKAPVAIQASPKFKSDRARG